MCCVKYNHVENESNTACYLDSSTLTIIHVNDKVLVNLISENKQKHELRNLSIASPTSASL